MMRGEDQHTLSIQNSMEFSERWPPVKQVVHDQGADCEVEFLISGKG